MDGMVSAAATLPERATLKGALDGLSEPVLLVDGALRVRFANTAARDWLGLTAGAGSGKRQHPGLASLLDASPALDAPARRAIEAIVRRAIATGTDASGGLDTPSAGPVRCSAQRIARCCWRITLGLAPERATAASGAGRDRLTGLPDGRVLREQLAAALGRGAATLILLDFDRFRALNSALGHAVADMLLAAAAGRIRTAIRAQDFAARLERDAFAILARPASSAQQASALSGRLIEVLTRPYLLDGQFVSASVSVGIARAPAGLREPDEMIRRAELALFEAKAEGRGLMRVYQPAMGEQARARSALETDLRAALALRQFTLAFQPQCNIRTRALTGFEALLRWEHPRRGPVPPAELIPVAEETGLIVPIGGWALAEACARAASWSGTPSIAVNVSPVQFRKGALLVEQVRAALRRSGLPACRLELEITESTLLADDGSTLATLRSLRELGVRIALDDFGTGYSSLSQLRRFPIDKLKIDRSFVVDLGRSERASAVVRAIRTLGDSLGIAIVVEGVETAEQALAVALSGCETVQGYLIGPPLAAGAVEDFIARSKLPEFARLGSGTAMPLP